MLRSSTKEFSSSINIDEEGGKKQRVSIRIREETAVRTTSMGSGRKSFRAIL